MKTLFILVSLLSADYPINGYVYKTTSVLTPKIFPDDFSDDFSQREYLTNHVIYILKDKQLHKVIRTNKQGRYYTDLEPGPYKYIIFYKKKLYLFDVEIYSNIKKYSLEL